MGSEVTSINNLTRKGSLKQGLQVIEGVRELPDWITKPFQNQVLSYNPDIFLHSLCLCGNSRGRNGKRPSSTGHPALKSTRAPLLLRTSHHFCNGYRPQAVKFQPLRTCQLSGSPQTHPGGNLLPETSFLPVAVRPFSRGTSRRGSLLVMSVVPSLR